MSLSAHSIKLLVSHLSNPSIGSPVLSLSASNRMPLTGPPWPFNSPMVAMPHNCIPPAWAGGWFGLHLELIEYWLVSLIDNLASFRHTWVAMPTEVFAFYATVNVITIVGLIVPGYEHTKLPVCGSQLHSGRHVYLSPIHIYYVIVCNICSRPPPGVLLEDMFIPEWS